jgi:putative transposase
VHLVFVTKYRRGVFADETLTACEHIMREVCHGKKAELLEFNGEHDHVHLLVAYPPALSISELVNRLKGVSSRLLRRDFDLRTHQGHLWSPSYFASSAGGASLDALKGYIVQQRRPS